MSGEEMLWQRDGVRITDHGDFLEVTLCSPENRNAQDPNTWRALAEVANEVKAQTRVVVLNAQGVSFSAGLHRKMWGAAAEAGTNAAAAAGDSAAAEPAQHETLTSLVRHDDETMDRFIQHAQSAFTWWANSPAITIASVQGHAIGAGFQLALGCDLIVAADDAQFAMRETSMGIVPDLGGTWPLVKRIGYSRALEICVTGRCVTAKEAIEIGLIDRVAPLAQLGAATEQLRVELSSAPIDAVRSLKQLLRAAEVSTKPEQLRLERAMQIQRLRSF
jgi:enoyl-CoA hydratase/carnithine racemase